MGLTRWKLVALALTVVVLVLAFALSEGDLEVGEPEVVASGEWWDPTTGQGVFGYLADIKTGPRSFAVGPAGDVYVADTLRSRVVKMTATDQQVFEVVIDGRSVEPDQVAVSPAGSVWVTTRDGYVLKCTPGDQTRAVRLAPEPQEPGSIWAIQRIGCLSEDRLAILDAWVDQERYTKRLAICEVSGTRVLGGFSLTSQGEILGLEGASDPHVLLDLANYKENLFTLEKGSTDGCYRVVAQEANVWEIRCRAQPRLLGVDRLKRVHILCVEEGNMTVVRYSHRGAPTGEYTLPVPDVKWQALVDSKGHLYLATHDEKGFTVRMFPVRRG